MWSIYLNAAPLETIKVNKDLILIPYHLEKNSLVMLKQIVNNADVYPTIRHGQLWSDELVLGRHNAYMNGNKSYESEECFNAHEFVVCWFIEYKGKIIGRLGVQPEDEIQPIIPEIFIAIKSPYQGIGIGFKACFAVKKWFNNKYPEIPLRWLSMEKSPASQKIALRLGFKQLLQKNKKSPFVTVNWGSRYLAYEWHPNDAKN